MPACTYSATAPDVPSRKRASWASLVVLLVLFANAPFTGAQAQSVSDRAALASSDRPQIYVVVLEGESAAKSFLAAKGPQPNTAAANNQIGRASCRGRV